MITVNGKKVAGVGPAGLSPYQVAKAGGYTSTEQEFNQQLAQLNQLFTSVSDGKSAIAAITDKGVTTAADATFQTMADNVGKIETGTDTSDATATAGDILSGKIAYGASGKITGTIPSQGATTITPGTISGTIQMYRDDGFLMSEDDTSQYIRQKYAGTMLAFFAYPEPEPVPTPTPEPRATNAQSLAAVNFARMMLPSMASTMSADDTITVAALYDEWTEGSYQVGDIRLAWYSGAHQPWKCRQEHDTTTYPDITPDGSAWRTFWIPFHGTTPETAQDWMAPSGAHDQYEAGDYMVWTDGSTYLCKQATVYTPEEYAKAWEVYNA